MYDYRDNLSIPVDPPLVYEVDKDGYMPALQGPGLGVEINPDLTLKS
jgi:L-alanine-DL-glutamate epimerase-like enolase superfamily enzyme